MIVSSFEYMMCYEFNDFWDLLYISVTGVIWVIFPWRPWLSYDSMCCDVISFVMVDQGISITCILRIS